MCPRLEWTEPMVNMAETKPRSMELVKSFIFQNVLPTFARKRFSFSRQLNECRQKILVILLTQRSSKLINISIVLIALVSKCLKLYLKYSLTSSLLIFLTTQIRNCYVHVTLFVILSFINPSLSLTSPKIYPISQTQTEVLFPKVVSWNLLHVRCT